MINIRGVQIISVDFVLTKCSSLQSKIVQLQLNQIDTEIRDTHLARNKFDISVLFG